MLEIIALLAPSLVALKFYNHLHYNTLPARTLVMTYGLFVILINLCLYAATIYLAGHDAIVFDERYFIKYLLLSLGLSIVIPFVVNLAEATVSVKVSHSNGKKK
ncbi:MAG: hypothetical protein ACTJG2_03190 [Candidatus Saccharimonadales bacterium]